MLCNGTFVGCIMYADDLVVLSVSVSGLQSLLDCCYQVSVTLMLTFNCLKSSYSVVGPASEVNISKMQLGSISIEWTSSFKYLGVVFNAGRKLSVDTDAIKRKFYTACNCLLGNTYSLNEILRINLHSSYCLPILQYATAAVELTKAHISELNACWDFVYRKFVGFYKHESVRSLIYGLGRLDFCHIRLLLVYKLIIKSLAGTCYINKFSALVYAFEGI